MGWVVNATARPLFPRQRDPVPTVQNGPQGRFGKTRPSLGFDLRTVQTVASGYRGPQEDVLAYVQCVSRQHTGKMSDSKGTWLRIEAGPSGGLGVSCLPPLC